MLKLILIITLIATSTLTAYIAGDWFSKEPSHLLQLESLVRHEIPLRIKMFRKTKDPQVLKIFIVGTDVIIVAREDGTGVIKLTKKEK